MPEDILIVFRAPFIADAAKTFRYAWSMLTFWVAGSSILNHMKLASAALLAPKKVRFLQPSRVQMHTSKEKKQEKEHISMRKYHVACMWTQARFHGKLTETCLLHICVAGGATMRFSARSFLFRAVKSLEIHASSSAVATCYMMMSMMTWGLQFMGAWFE